MASGSELKATNDVIKLAYERIKRFEERIRKS